MSEPSVTWRKLKKYLNANGYELDHDGGDILVIKPPDKHRIGHVFCNKATAQISDAHLTALRRKFGITRKDILG